MHSKAALMLTHSCVTVFAAILVSSTYFAHWSVFISVFKYSLMKLEDADSDRLRPWANCRNVKVRLADLKASIWIVW